MGDAEACEQAISRLVGIDDEGLRRAAGSYCAGKGTAGPDCVSAWAAQGELLRRAATNCAAGDPSGCEILGDALSIIDPARSGAAYERTCKLRALDADELWRDWQTDLRDPNGTPFRRITAKDGGLACCVASLHSTRDLRKTTVSLPSVDPATWTPKASLFGGRGATGKRPKAVVARGEVAVRAGAHDVDELATAVDTLAEAWTACYLGGLEHNPNLQGDVKLDMVVDGRGRPLPVAVDGNLPDTAVVYCIARALQSLKTGTGDACRVTVSLDLHPG